MGLTEIENMNVKIDTGCPYTSIPILKLGEVYSAMLHKWGVQSDIYDIMLNISAEETVASGSIEVKEGDQLFFFTSMTPLVQFVRCPAFHSYLGEHVPKWLQDFFDLSKTDYLVLMLPLPFYRLSEPLQGEPMFTKTQILEIIKCCNEYVARHDGEDA
ncbi:MAG: hypothetical protein HFH15_11080 [Ruminococcus sp.]|nr:hypothetical protein [Ruminococcus sp.]